MLIGLQILFLLGVPLLASQLHQRFQWFSPIIASYAIGIAIGNLIPDYLDDAWSMHITELAVLLAIPMLLFGSSMKALFKQSKQPSSFLPGVETVSTGIISMKKIWKLL